MADPTSTRFELFTQHFWTEENKEAYEYALFLTNSSKKSLYTIDDSLFDWLFQFWEPNVYFVVGHEKIIIFYSGHHPNNFSDVTRNSNIELKTFSDKDADVAHEVCEFIGSSHVAVTNNFDDEDRKSKISSLSTTNTQAQLEEVLIVHEASELTRCRNAAKIADRGIRKVLEKNLVTILEDHEPTECSEFSRSIVNDLIDPNSVNLKFQQNQVAPAFPPAISCGRHIRIDFPPENDGNIPSTVFNTAISATVGIRFKSYVGAVGRTYLINANEEQKKAYKAVVEARKACLEMIQFGTNYSEIYNQFKEKLDPMYHDYIPKSIGTFSGIQICTEYHSISENSEDVVKPSTMLILTFGLQDYPIETKDESMDNKFSFQITDTFQVGDVEKEVKLLTSDNVDFENIAYDLDTTDSKKLQEELANDKSIMAERTRHHNQQNNQKIDHENSKIYEDLRLFSNKQREKTEKKAEVQLDQVSYKSEKDLHSFKGSKNQIKFDEENTKTVFLPIYGVLVPFHAGRIKQATDDNSDDKVSYLTVKFEVPKPDAKDISPSSIFIHEAQFITKGTKKFEPVAKKIRELKAQYTSELKRMKDKEGLFRTTEKIERLENNVPRIGGGNLHIRPVLNGKKSLGNLEAHKNCFRFRSTAGDTVLIFYSNIRLAVFQKSRKETITLIHFYLDKPIQINNKPTLNITFFKQVVESAVDTSIRSSSMTDQGEMAEEEREERIRKRINNDFTEFCKAVNDLSDQNPNANIKKFERPIRKLGFYGVPDRSRVLIMPTVNALVAVQEQPPFVLMREDIKIAVFEHKDINTNYFDLTFILNDWEEADINNAISQILTIGDEYFEQIKGWIEAVQIKYYVRKGALSWKKLLPDLRKRKDFRPQTDEDWDEILIESESETDEDDPDNTDDQAFVDDDEDEDDDDDDDFDEDAPDTDEDDDAPAEEDDDSENDWDRLKDAAESYDSRHSKRFKDDEDPVSKKKHKSDKEHHHHHHSKH